MLAILYFGIQEGDISIKAAYKRAISYFPSWFPHLPLYKQFARRVKRLAAATCHHAMQTCSLGPFQGQIGFLMDSVPIVLSKKTQMTRPRRLDGLADVGYCASKKMHYYGVKLHVIAERNLQGLPQVQEAFVQAASMHDLTAFKTVSHAIYEREIYCDKAYCHQDFQNEIALEQGVLLATPIKKEKGLEETAFAKIHNGAISHWRQPIEALFADIIRKTNIQTAKLVRSVDGLIAHIYSKLTAYLLQHSH